MIERAPTDREPKRRRVGPVTIRESTWINGSPASAWQRVTALEQWPSWHQDLVQARWLGGNGWKTGHRFRLRYRGRLRPHLGSGRIVEVDPERSLAWSDRWLTLSILFRLGFVGEGTGTRVEFVADVGGWGRRIFGGDSWTRWLTRHQKEFLVDLREACERVAGS